ncbi:hypothetical protein BUE80_DR002285 [Diplocarpon rosae]|nr:hypothetical protein BUE80_DR002285 [Diplocarpon rosae]
MESSLLQRSRTATLTAGKAPPLPPRSLRRTSTLLDNVMLELENMAGERPKEDKSQLTQLDEEEHDPHELYLSTSSATWDAAQARPAMRRPAPLNLYQARPRSVATTTGHLGSPNYTYTPAMPTNASMVSLPLRPTNTDTDTDTAHPPHHRSSRLASLVMAMTSKNNTLSAQHAASSSVSTTSTHSFLDSDPFATSSNVDPPLTPNSINPATTPKTPTSISTTWKRSLSRTLSKARKPSLRKLNTAYHSSLPATAAPATAPVSPATMPTLTRITSNPEPSTPRLLELSSRHRRESDVSMHRAETMPVAPRLGGAPTPSHEVTSGVVRIPPPIPETSSFRPRGARKSFSLAMGRKKSIKGEGKGPQSVPHTPLSSPQEKEAAVLAPPRSVSFHESGTSSRASSRSREVTATAVNFTLVGKPQIIEITIPSTQPSPVYPSPGTPLVQHGSAKRHTMRVPASASAPIITASSATWDAAQARPAMRRPAPLNLYQARPRSVATTTGHLGSPNYTYTPAMPTNASMVSLPLRPTNTDTDTDTAHPSPPPDLPGSPRS